MGMAVGDCTLPDVVPTSAYLGTARDLSDPLIALGVSLEELAFGGPIRADVPVVGWMGKPGRVERLPGEPTAGRPGVTVVRLALVGELFSRALMRQAEAAGIAAFAPTGDDLARLLADAKRR